MTSKFQYCNNSDELSWYVNLDQPGAYYTAGFASATFNSYNDIRISIRKWIDANCKEVIYAWNGCRQPGTLQSDWGEMVMPNGASLLYFTDSTDYSKFIYDWRHMIDYFNSSILESDLFFKIATNRTPHIMPPTSYFYNRPELMHIPKEIAETRGRVAGTIYYSKQLNAFQSIIGGLFRNKEDKAQYILSKSEGVPDEEY